ncbi:hypothetical protein TNCV_4241881 [Trichonephila clavipes]|nr:hypothetical protein TNCV_4241881 [Trichonephila clavipes]
MYETNINISLFRFAKEKELREKAEKVSKTTNALRTLQISHTTENIEKVSASVRKNRLQTIAESVGISSAAYQGILTKNLNMHRACQHIATRILNENQSADEVKSASQAEIKNVAKNGFQKRFGDLNKSRQKCVVIQWSYFEGGCVSAV